jgi:hypothetical protein
VILHYAQSWEDTQLLQQIIGKHPAQYHHMIASGGDHAFSLIKFGVEHINLVDSEVIQLEHIQSKIKALEHPEREMLFGIDRVNNGLLHSGKLEKYLRKFSTILPLLLKPSARNSITNCISKEERVRVIKEKWETKRLRLVSSLFFSKKNINGIRHPGLSSDISKSSSGVNYLENFKSTALQYPIKENPYLDYIIHGYHKNSSLDYLKKSWAPKTSSLTLIHQDFFSYVKKLKTAIHFIHASDIMEGTSSKFNNRLFQAVDEVSESNSTFLYWEHRYEINVPESFKKKWVQINMNVIDRVPFYNNYFLWKKAENH